MNANNYLITKVLNHLTGGAVWTPPTTLYLALLKTAPVAGDTPSGAGGKELVTPTTLDYDRQEITAFTTSTGGSSLASNVLLTFGPSTTGWPQAIGAWIVDSNVEGDGNIWLQGLLVTAKTAGASDSILFAVGEVIFALA